VAVSEIETPGAAGDRANSGRGEAEKPASAVEGLETDGGETETGATPDSGQDVESGSEAEHRALAIATEGGPLAEEIELEPVDLRPLLQPSSADVTTVEPAVGFWGRHGLFISTVIVPMMLGAVYLFAVATPRYASTASFLVRSVPAADPQIYLQMIAPMASSAAGQASASASQLGTSMQPQPASSSTQQAATATITSSPMQQQSLSLLQSASAVDTDATYAIDAYLTSRDVVDQLAKNNNLQAILSRPEADFLFRYPTFWLPDDREFFYRRFQWIVSSKVDNYTLIDTIEVNAFRPEDAQALANAILESAEARVAEMDRRVYDSELAGANNFLSSAQKEVNSVQAELQAYRNASGSIDPNAVAQSELQVIQGLQTQLAQVRATIAQQVAMAPTSPNLAPLRAQAKSIRDQIDKREKEITGSSASEADKLEKYAKLTTRAQLAATTLAAAVAERDQARLDVVRRHDFIQVIARPSLSRDYARYPRVVLVLLVLLGLCLAAFYSLRNIGRVNAEHRA
jgi:capsular polysaccharide transport system permease protein